MPKDLKDDNVIPYASSIPSLMRSIRHPGRSRSVTLGPQSQADAYETLAYREKRRRESTSDITVMTPLTTGKPGEDSMPSSYFTANPCENGSAQVPMSARLPTPAHSETNLYPQLMGAEIAVRSPLILISQPDTGSPRRSPSEDRRLYEKEEREMFSTLEKPRVRYDVEVVTKLIVYMGKGLSDLCKEQSKLTINQALPGSLWKAILSSSNSWVLACQQVEHL